VKIKYSGVAAVSRRWKVVWFETRVIFDDDDVVWTPFRLNVFVWLPIAAGSTGRCVRDAAHKRDYVLFALVGKRLLAV
jgi:hypothetical protein